MTTDTATTRPASVRLHGLDALRGGALLLGILLHSLMTFVPPIGDMPMWIVQDTHPTPFAMPTIAVIHLFRMTLFMVLAGYFARVVVMKRGMPRFLRGRSIRIALPVFAFWPVAVLPMALVATVWGAAHGITITAPTSDAPALLQAFSPGHLWFLWTLFQCCLILAVLRWVGHRLAPQATDRFARAAAAVIVSPVGLFALAVPYIVTALWQGTTYAGIDEPRTILPEAPSLLSYVTAFTVGWLLARRRDALTILAGSRVVHLALAVVGSLLVLLLSGMLGVPAPGGTWNYALAVLFGLTSWAWVLGLLGVGVRELDRERPWMRYLADASYWMYLMHLPLLCAVQGTLTHLDWPVPLKLALALAVTTVVLLLTYDAFVRSTWIGAWLNGHRRPRVLFARRGRGTPAVQSGHPVDSARTAGLAQRKGR